MKSEEVELLYDDKKRIRERAECVVRLEYS